MVTVELDTIRSTESDAAARDSRMDGCVHHGAVPQDAASHRALDGRLRSPGEEAGAQDPRSG